MRRALALARLDAVVLAALLFAVTARRARSPRPRRPSSARRRSSARRSRPHALYELARFGHVAPASRPAIKLGGALVLTPAALATFALALGAIVVLARRELTSAIPAWALPLGAAIAVQAAVDAIVHGG